VTPAQSSIDGRFNKACYQVPAPYTFGNASRTDPRVRTHGIANYDFALSKKTSITERYVLEFRTEFFNLFHRVQFGRPDNQASTAANDTFGFITAQEDFGRPRLIQFALRLSFLAVGKGCFRPSKFMLVHSHQVQRESGCALRRANTNEE
jgi:hypothetical protein